MKRKWKVWKVCIWEQGWTTVFIYTVSLVEGHKYVATLLSFIRPAMPILVAKMPRWEITTIIKFLKMRLTEIAWAKIYQQFKHSFYVSCFCLYEFIVYSNTWKRLGKNCLKLTLMIAFSTFLKSIPSLKCKLESARVNRMWQICFHLNRMCKKTTMFFSIVLSIDIEQLFAWGRSLVATPQQL